MGPGQPLCGFRDDTQERLALDRGRELRDAPVMALLDWIAPESGLRVEGQGIVLRPPRAADYPEWRELRARSRGFLQPWEPTWPSDDLSRAAFRRRLAAYARDRELGVAYAFFVLRSSDEAVEEARRFRAGRARLNLGDESAEEREKPKGFARCDPPPDWCRRADPKAGSLAPACASRRAPATHSRAAAPWDDRQMDTEPLTRRLAGRAQSTPADSVNRAWLRALKMAGRLERSPERTLPEVVEEQALARGSAAALLSDEEQLSYGDLAALSRRWARFALDQGLRKGDVVALVAHNHPGYLAAWLGLTRVGVVVALVNPRLKGEALAHCLAAAAPRLVIAAEASADAVRSAMRGACDPDGLWLLGSGPARGVRRELSRISADPLTPGERTRVTLSDPALLIYTSGTTGLPKAARVSHRRVMSWSSWFAGLLQVTPADRLYNCLPMHHSVGGVVATGALLVGGGSIVIAPRFSASAFWDDLVRWDCTLFQYIGELCRYLVNTPPCASERRHRLRIACGNGLSAAVWDEFQARFGVPRIVEFYAATEGNFSLFNLEGEPGAVGRVPRFMAHRFPVAIVAFDPKTDAPRRGPGGLCIRCRTGVAGEAISRISGSDPAQAFEGYTSALETERKVLRDVFEPGDAWLRSGDLMRVDERGFFRFVERIGGSFRWKGENVSAAEVERIVEGCPGVAAAAVYGVAVPKTEGRAGMAAIVAGPGFRLGELRRRLDEALPGYARPLFIRLIAALPATETFKTATHCLAAEGFDPRQISDPLFFDVPARGAYAPLARDLFDRIGRGELRL